MTETQAEMEYRREKAIEKAVIAIDRVIMDNSDGTEQGTNCLTASVGYELYRIACLPLNLGIVPFHAGKINKREIVQQAVQEGRSIIEKSSFVNEDEYNYMFAAVAEKFVEKALRAFRVRLLVKDLKMRYGGREESHGNPRKRQ